MGKKLTSTVHFANSETGETRVVKPSDKLSAEDLRSLEKDWGKRIGEITEDDGEDDEDKGEDVSRLDQSVPAAAAPKAADPDAKPAPAKAPAK